MGPSRSSAAGSAHRFGFLVALAWGTLLPLAGAAGSDWVIRFQRAIGEFRQDSGEVTFLESTGTLHQSTRPMVPEIAVKVLLPYGYTISEIRVTPSDKEVLEGAWFPAAPCACPLPIGCGPCGADPEIYQSPEPFPGTLAEMRSGWPQFFGGYAIALVHLYPVQYLPALRLAECYHFFDVELLLELGEYPPLCRLNAEDVEELLFQIDELPPDVLESYPCQVGHLAYPSRACVGSEVTLSVRAVPDAIGYDFEIARDGGDWSPLARVEEPWIAFRFEETGTYQFRARAVGAYNQTIWSAGVTTDIRECVFLRGDANDDSTVDISDPIAILGWLFIGGSINSCWDRADFDDDSRVDISDAVAPLMFLFGDGPSPHPPYPEAGGDPTPDILPCVP